MAFRLAKEPLEQVRQFLNGLGVGYQIINNSSDVLVKIIAPKRDSWQIEEKVKALNGQSVDLKDILFFSGTEGRVQLEERLAEVEGKKQLLVAQSKAIITDQVANLSIMWKKLKLNELYSATLGNFNTTKATRVFAGWLPKASINKVLKALTTATNGCFSYNLSSEGAVYDKNGLALAAPTYLKNPAILKPFELLIKTYSVPAYGTIDSTGIVALFFVAMFGFMFADAGQGLIVLLIGLAMAFKGKSMANLGVLLSYCGVSAVVMGVLFGSYFGFPALPPLWFDYHGIVATGEAERLTGSSISNIMDIMGLALKFGLGVIGLSFVFNFINHIRRGKWLELILSRNGLLGAFMYVVGVWAAWHYIDSGYKTIPSPHFLGVALLIPSLLLFLEGPLGYLESRHHGAKARKGLVSEWVLNWLIELLEFYINAMSNTLSFIRVAALGVAHVALMSALYGMGEGLPMAGKIVLYIFTNVLVIGLEGFSAAINSVRLNYYEFFSRFFAGDGRLYSPISLRTGALK
jgi:V/A-type H+-transporting ATPase subunit I